MTTPYTAGTITLTAGSAVVTGVGTAWQTALIAGGVISPDAPGGNALPILSVDSDTQITAAIPWRGASGTYGYALTRDAALGEQIVVNSQALAEYLSWVRAQALGALASLSGSMGADKLAYATGTNSMAWTDFTDFARAILSDPDAATMRATLGDVFAKNLPLANDILTGAAADFNVLPGSGLWQLDFGGGPNLNGPDDAYHHLCIQVGNEVRGLQIAAAYNDPTRLYFRVGSGDWSAWGRLSSALYSGIAASAAGGNEANLGLDTYVTRLSVDFAPRSVSLYALASFVVDNFGDAPTGVWSRLLLTRVSDGAEIAATASLSEIVKSQARQATQPLSLTAAGLDLAATYRLALQLYKTTGVTPVYPLSMKIDAIHV